MTQSAPVLKDGALREYYEALFAMFATPGWRFLMEDVAHMQAVNDRTAGIETLEQLHSRKGELGQMQWLLKFPETVEATYNALLAEQEGTREAQASGGIAKIVEPAREEPQ